jgi:hypothetical protein
MTLSAPLFSFRGARAAVLLALALLAASSAVVQQAGAQDASQLKARAQAILKQPQDPTAAERTILDDYFGKSFFPEMTDASPEGLGKLAEKREDLFKYFLNVRGSQAAHDHLLTVTMKAVRDNIAIKPYHPAIRYNAVLIIGQLDKEVSKSGSADPVPYADATKTLVVLLEEDKILGVPVTSPVKLAALIGLDRHTRLGADPTLAERINAAALAVATNSEAPADASPAAHDWMRRLAVRVLANQQAKGLTTPVYEAMAKLVGSKQMNLDDRCSIAEMLRAPMIQGAQGLNPETMTLALGKLARDVTAFEAKEAKKYQKELLGNDTGGGFVGGGGLEGGFGSRGGLGGEFNPMIGLGPEGGFGGAAPAFDPAALEGPHIEKRRLLARLKAVADAADQLAAASADDTKQRMVDLAAPLRSAFDDAVKSTEMDAATAMIELAGTIETLVDEWAPAEPAADEAEPAAEEEPAADAEAAPAEAAEEPPAAEPAPADAAGN